MITPPIVKKRNAYYFHLMEYKRRRERYYRQIRNVTKKMASWKRQIKRIDERVASVDFIGKKIKEFTGVSIKNTKDSKDKSLSRARQFFYKCGFEKGISQVYLYNYTGVVGYGNSSIYHRKTLNALLRTDAEVKQQWESFKIFMNENDTSV